MSVVIKTFRAMVFTGFIYGKKQATIRRLFFTGKEFFMF